MKIDGSRQRKTQRGVCSRAYGRRAGPSGYKFSRAEARSFGEMLAFMGLADRTKFRRKYIHPLLEGGYVELTIPDKPNSQNQKYHLTAKGIALKNSLTSNK